MKRIGEFLKGVGGAWILAAVIAAFTAVFAVWQGAVNQDEGWYLYAAQLVREGRLPYRDFFFTQGPALPFVYAPLSGIWVAGGACPGLLGGRLVTFVFAFGTILCAMGLARRIAGTAHRAAAGLAVFALLACNLYHVYFTAIPKTYALGGLFLTAGLLALVSARGRVRLTLAGLLLAFASGTRISLVLSLPVAGLAVLFRGGIRNAPRNAPDFVLFCLGGFAGLGIVYGFFAADPASLRGLLAAQAYHAGRGGFDPLFAIGSVSRWARGYIAAGVLLFAGLAWRAFPTRDEGDVSPWALKTLLAVFAVVFLLQLSAPFPYDDYQVPLMPVLCAGIAALFARTGRTPWFAVLVAGLCSFANPLLQEWATAGQDRFWSVKKDRSELAQLRATAREINRLDPNGRDLLTQDLYLAVETGRRVPEGLEMGPFSYFGEMPTDEAKALHVLNRERMTALLEAAPCAMAAFSGYGFAISVPKCDEVPQADQRHFRELLARRYETVLTEPRFGQNATTLHVFRRRPTP